MWRWRGTLKTSPQLLLSSRKSMTRKLFRVFCSFSLLSRQCRTGPGEAGETDAVGRRGATSSVLWTMRGEAGRLPAPSGASRHRPARLTLDNERPRQRAARRPDTPQSVARKLENRNAVWRTVVRSGAAERWVVWHGGAEAAWRCSNSGVVTSVVSGDTRHPFMATGGLSEAAQPWIGPGRATGG